MFSDAVISSNGHSIAIKVVCCPICGVMFRPARFIIRPKDRDWHKEMCCTNCEGYLDYRSARESFAKELDKKLSEVGRF